MFTGNTHSHDKHSLQIYKSFFIFKYYPTYEIKMSSQTASCDPLAEVIGGFPQSPSDKRV